jgi:hypothetical protein
VLEPRTYAWIIDRRLAVAERPGGGGRAHRRARRDAELAWWKAQGVTTIISGMRTRHGLLDAALAGFRVAWHPLVTADQAARELRILADDAAGHMETGAGAVLVHVDRPGEWLAAADAALRIRTGRARDRARALAQARDDGFPVGDLARALLAGPEPTRSRRAARSTGTVPGAAGSAGTLAG